MCNGAICGGKPKGNFDLSRFICIGFGIATVTKNGVSVYDEMTTEREWSAKHPRSKKCPPFWNGKRAEREARKDPNHDWQIMIHGPMSGGTWKRVKPNLWELIESNGGFA